MCPGAAHYNTKLDCTIAKLIPHQISLSAEGNILKTEAGEEYWKQLSRHISS